MRKASFKDYKTIVDILHAAFITETFPNSINFVVKQDHKRSKRVYHLMEYQCKMALYFGTVFISDKEETCILVLHSEKKRVTIQMVLLNMKLAVFCIGIRNIPKVIKRERLLKAKKKVRRIKIFYIHLAGYTESNRKFYEKMGFTVFNESNDLEYPLYFLLKSPN